MALEVNHWGPAGTLEGLSDFSAFEGNGVSDFIANLSASAMSERADLITIDGHSAIQITHFAGDATVASGNRTEISVNNYSGVYDWVGEGVVGATLNSSYKRYRVRFQVPEQDLSYLSGAGGPFFICAQLHTIPDDSPADTGGGQPALSVHVRVDSYGRYRFALVQNHPSDATYTGPDISHEVASWPFRFGEWQDIHVHANPWSHSTAGNMTVYLNRRPIFAEISQPNCHNNSPDRGGGGLWPKFGCYGAPSVFQRVVHCGYLLGDHEATFADMYPEIYGAVPLERVAGPSASIGI
jgi:hypothetical protein